MDHSIKTFSNFIADLKSENEIQIFKQFLSNHIREYLENEGKEQLENIASEKIINVIKEIEEKLVDIFPKESDEYISNRSAQDFTKLSRTTLYKLSKSDPHFPKPKRIGRRILYSKRELTEFLHRIKRYSPDPP